MALHRDPLSPPPPSGLQPAAALAVGAHLLLILALSVGVNWQLSDPSPAEAQLWSAIPQIAGPAPAETLPPEEADPKPVEPVPVPPPVPAPAPTPVKEPEPTPDAELAEAQAKAEAKKKAEQIKKREEAQRLEKERLEKDRRDKEKREKDQREREQAEKDRREKDRLEKQRQENLRRMMGQAGSTQNPSQASTGTASQSSGPSAGYAGRIVARIRPNIVLTDGVDGNPVAEVELRLAADGRILSRKLIQSSKNAAWDEAVLRAVDRTEVLPRDTDGKVPQAMVIRFRPKD